MKIRFQFLLVVLTLPFLLKAQKSVPLCLHPENPHYFLFRGKPTILIASAEHYGSVMNRDFDFIKYLNALQKEGFNYTRIFCSGHLEMNDATFGIERNTMNPRKESYLAPWKKIKDGETSSPGVYDLNQWNEEYFKRLRQFVNEASLRGIVVEVTLSSSIYNASIWSYNPLNPANNINLQEPKDYKLANTLYNSDMLIFQERYIQKIVTELNEFDNIIYEIQNEPWSDHPCLQEIVPSDNKTHPFAWQKLAEIANPVSRAWQHHIAGIIAETESRLSNRHLISENISNFRAKISTPDSLVSVFNFHYALPEAVRWNYNLNKVIALDETGFMPHRDYLYRSQAWKFLLSGGGLYNNLDYSFVVGFEDGTWPIPDGNPGWGGPAFRKQLIILKDCLYSMPFVKMKPLPTDRNEIFGLAEKGRNYLVYMGQENVSSLPIELPSGTYSIRWISPVTGDTLLTDTINVTDSEWTFSPPQYKEDVVLMVIRVK
jgi:hypothetical protein